MKHVAFDILYNTSFIDGLFVGSSVFLLLIVKNHLVRWASCMFFKGKHCDTTGSIHFSKNREILLLNAIFFCV